MKVEVKVLRLYFTLLYFIIYFLRRFMCVFMYCMMINSPFSAPEQVSG